MSRSGGGVPGAGIKKVHARKQGAGWREMEDLEWKGEGQKVNDIPVFSSIRCDDYLLISTVNLITFWDKTTFDVSYHGETIHFSVYFQETDDGKMQINLRPTDGEGFSGSIIFKNFNNSSLSSYVESPIELGTIGGKPFLATARAATPRTGSMAHEILINFFIRDIKDADTQK
jgi:hypothetical protein